MEVGVGGLTPVAVVGRPDMNVGAGLGCFEEVVGTADVAQVDRDVFYVADESPGCPWERGTSVPLPR